MKVLKSLLGAVTAAALASAGLAAEHKRPQWITAMQPRGERPMLISNGPVRAIHMTPDGRQQAVSVVAKGTAARTSVGRGTDPVIEVLGADEVVDGEALGYSLSVTAGAQDLPPFTLDMQYSEGLNLGVDPQGWQCTFDAPGHASCDWLTTLPAGQTTDTATFSAFAQPPYGGTAECDPGRSPCTFLRATLPGATTGFAATAIVVSGNHPPIAVDDTTVVAVPPAPITFDVLDNDSDQDMAFGDMLTVSIAVPPAQGTATVDPVTKRITYTPDPSFVANDTLRYRITDLSGASATALVTIQQLTGSVSFQSPVTDIGNVELGHIAFRWAYLENTTGLDLVGNHTVEPVDPAEFPALLAGTGYDPAEAVSDVSVFSGTGGAFFDASPINVSSVLCRLNPPLGRVWLARVRFTLSPVISPSVVLETSYVVVARSADASEVPVHVVDDVVTTPVDTPILIHPLVNDDSAAGLPLSVSGLAAAEPFHFDPPFMEGSVAFADGQNGGVPFLGALYTPPPGFQGTTAFYYAASETPGGIINGRYDYAKITVGVGNVANHAPVAHSRTDTILHDTTSSEPTFLLASDADGDPVTLRIVTPPAHGSASIFTSGTGGLEYVPALHFVGTDSYQFVVNDGIVDSNVATITVTVTNAVPVAASQARTVSHDTTSHVPAFQIASDADGDPVTLRIVTPPAHGSASIFTSGTGGLEYVPALHFAGTDSYQFVVNDGIVDSNVATITVTVTNAVPVAASQARTVSHDTTSHVPAFQIASDADGDPLTPRIVTPPTHGSASVVTGGTGGLQYVPSLHFVGTDSYQFVVNDGVVDSNVATISITVTEAAPVLGGLTNLTVAELTPAGFTATATDADIEALTFSLVGAPAGAQIDSSSGVFAWLPSEGQGPGTYTFSVRATDTLAAFDEKPITITVTEVNAAPSLSLPALPAHIPAGFPFGFTATASDPDLPVNTLGFSLSGAPAGASIGSGSGVFSWTPGTAQVGSTYTFAVVVTDDGTPALAAQQSVTVTVDAPPTAALLVSAAPDRSNAQSLGGQTLSRLVYIFVGPGAGVTRVRFWLDDPARTGPPTHVENLPPFDFAGTAANGSAQAYDTRRLSNGPHVVSAEVTLSGGQIVQLQETFTAANAVPALLVSVSPNRANPRALAGAFVRNNVYVFIRPDPDAVRVRFWLDAPTSQPPHHTETTAPYDFQGTAANGNAAPFDTRTIAVGLHRIRATVDYPGGVAITVSSFFLVTH